VVIDDELGREDHSSIPRNCNREKAGTTWCQNWPPNQINLVVKAKKTILPSGRFYKRQLNQQKLMYLIS
jgi:hypothetical protein